MRRAVEQSTLGFVADGCERLCEALRPRIESEVRARFAAVLAAADGRGRWASRARIEAEIRAEIERRLAEEAPPEALY